MTSSGPILLNPGEARGQTKILQLYPHVELFSEGEPPANSLFILGRASPTGDPSGQDQLLIVDPPLDIASRFRLDGPAAILFTGEPLPVGLPLLQTQPGGAAHIRVGEHFIDIHTQRRRAVVHLPALGLLCSGDLGSDQILPSLAEGSDGDEELQTLRLLARLLKQRRLQLMIPRLGNPTRERETALMRLAGDVAYLHGLRRVIPPLAAQGDPLAQVLRVAATLVPPERHT
ncbi:MAG TPA: hypothetical protein VNK95_18150, partial [Caldilineaceae bacterium]|nr:hypothetical protein [Caldilineaceae bacterium]